MLTETQQIPGLAPVVTLTSQYAAGNRTQLAAAVGGTNDFVNNYQYTSISAQMSQVSQTANGGDAVAAKAGTFQYDLAGELVGVGRYQNADATQNLVALAAYGYDADGNLTSLVYSNGASTLPSYSWTYDAAGNMLTASETLGSIVDSVTYANDSTGQLLSATPSPLPPGEGQGEGAPSESFSYDSNGNRTNTGYVTGPNNELLSDGTYNYSYDADGNCILRTSIADGSQTLYSWDNRNRLTLVVSKDGSGNVTQTVTYLYDAANRWIGETVQNGYGDVTLDRRFIYDGNQVVLQFGHAGGNVLGAGDLGQRYLWGPVVDQLLADEQVSNGDLLVWALGDNQNTVRDLATYSGGTTTVVNLRVFSAYGQLLSQSNPGTTPPSAATVDCLFAYTGRPLDKETGLQNNLNRWYDVITGRWLSQDPIGFAGGDGNLYRIRWKPREQCG